MTKEDHLVDLKKIFERLRKYDLKLNPNKCAFGTISSKLLGLIVSQCEIEIGVSKTETIPKCRLQKL